MISCHSIKFFGTVLVVQLVGEVKTGDKILIGDDDNIPKTINKIDCQHKDLPSAPAGQQVGLIIKDMMTSVGNPNVYKVK